MTTNKSLPIVEPKAQTKNIAGPPVYYPPGQELFAKNEAQAAWKAKVEKKRYMLKNFLFSCQIHNKTFFFILGSQGGYAKGSGKYEYEAESKSKSASKSGAAVVPVCLPLCCAMPCTIM